MADPSNLSSLSGVTVNIPADSRILSALLGIEQPNQSKTNETIATLCPTTYDLLQKANSHCHQILEENQGISLKKFAAQALSIPVMLASTVYGLSYWNHRSPNHSYSLATAFNEGTWIMKQTPQAAQTVVSQALEVFGTRTSSLASQKASECMADLAKRINTGNGSLNDFAAQAEQCAANFDNSLMIPISPVSQVHPAIPGFAAAVSGLFAFAYAGNYWHWRSLGEFANELQTHLPKIEKELIQAELVAEVNPIQAILKSQIKRLREISEIKKTESWPKACAAASFALASIGAYFGVQPLASYGAIASIYFIGVDLFKNGFQSKFSAEASSLENLQQRTERYLTL